MEKQTLKTLARDERGLTTMEYAVMFVLIVVGSISLWGSLGQELAGQIKSGTGTFSGELDGAQGGFSGGDD